MPRKRPASVRLAEMQEKMDNLKLEMAIEDMRAKKRGTRRKTKRRN